MAASIADTKSAINSALRQRGGPHAGYSCKVVSWDDVSRGKFGGGTVGGGLSCLGPNITDTYLKAKNGMNLFTVRPDNWNEKLGVVSADEVAVVCNPTGGPKEGASLAPRTLRDFIDDLARHGEYAGLRKSMLDANLDRKVSIRFQTTFLPVEGARGTMEFATEAYNYQTRSDADPRNLVLLCTTQGVAVQQDGAGAKRLFHHVSKSDGGSTARHWLEAERSVHQVGQAQTETATERADALARGKAVSSVIGIRALGTRFNVLMTVQVPLKQKQQRPQRPALVCGFSNAGGEFGGGGFFGAPPPSFGAEMMGFCGAPTAAAAACAQGPAAGPSGWGLGQVKSRGGRLRKKCKKRTGVANAARVSRGTKYDDWAGLTVKDPTRHPSEHLTVTCVIYNTVAGGVPTQEDVIAAVDDLESLYAACNPGRLGSAKFDFMKTELTVADTQTIAAKLATQPPPGPAIQGFDAFPVSSSSPPVPPAIGAEPAAVVVPVPAMVGIGAGFVPAYGYGRVDGVSPAVAAAVAKLPEPSAQVFNYVHDALGLAHLDAGGEGNLRTATSLFELANTIHVKVSGKPSSTALYNLACCHSLRKKMDEAATYLLQAVAAGYANSQHVGSDPDLEALRASRPGKVALAQRLVGDIAST